jgi:hypothetical protein
MGYWAILHNMQLRQRQIKPQNAFDSKYMYLKSQGLPRIV